MRIRRGIWGTCWLLSLIIISFYGGAVSYGIFFSLTLIPLISFIYIFCVWFCYKIYQEIGSRNIVCGQTVPYCFVLQNETWFAFAGIKVLFFSDFSYMEELPEEIEFELLPGEKYSYETAFVCKYRGEYEVGIKEVIISDFFGLFCLKRAIRETKKVIVAPKMIKINVLKSIIDSAIMQRENLRLMMELDVVTKEYSAGDPLKWIHWKATARENRLKSRKLIGEEKRGVALFFDTQRCDKERRVYLPIENKILETVLALSLFMAESSIPVSYFYSQGGLKQGMLYGAGDMEEFYQQIKAVQFSKREDMHTGIGGILQRESFLDKYLAFFVLHKIDHEILKMTQRFAENGVIIIFYIITGKNIEKFCMMSDMNRRIIAITPEEELEEVL